MDPWWLLKSLIADSTCRLFEEGYTDHLLLPKHYLRIGFEVGKEAQKWNLIEPTNEEFMTMVDEIWTDPTDCL
jgi:hypothetical protein